MMRRWRRRRRIKICLREIRTRTIEFEDEEEGINEANVEYLKEDEEDKIRV